MMISSDSRQRIAALLEQLYGDAAPAGLDGILERIARFRPRRRGPADLWDERDVLLITYGDQVRRPDEAPLATLHDWLRTQGLDRLVSAVHVLPFFPFSSDDGFSVIDYRTVAPGLGTWQDLHRLSESFDLAFDLVLNHCSTQHLWFRQYLARQEPYTRYFIEGNSEDNLSAVVRPRTTPLLTRFETARGPRSVWTTFSADQVDLNFAAPEVLLEMLDVLLFYVEQGVRIVRLDAIAYLWKTPGTCCIHLPPTHAVVKLMRLLLDAIAPGTLLLTETNVPHKENVSYFGTGDEAHLVYQFSLPPLLLDAMLTGDARYLSEWLARLEPTPRGTAFLNFTASHDGIGLRPAEGLLPPDRIDRLVESVRACGGLVGSRTDVSGAARPYELTTTWFSALGDPEGQPIDRHVDRFLATQAIMLSLRGIPAVYFHSLLGTWNDREGVRRTGHARAINRRKYTVDELDDLLRPEDSVARTVFDGYRRLLTVRRAQPAFHPDALQEVLDPGVPEILAFSRTSLDGKQKILVVANVSRRKASVNIERYPVDGPPIDLLDGGRPVAGKSVVIRPYQVMWLRS